jgi:hypothetical protein
MAASTYAIALLKVVDRHPSLFIVNFSFEAARPWKFVDTVRASKGLRHVPILLVADTKLSSADAERAVGCSANGFLLRLPPIFQSDADGAEAMGRQRLTGTYFGDDEVKQLPADSQFRTDQGQDILPQPRRQQPQGGVEFEGLDFFRTASASGLERAFPWECFLARSIWRSSFSRRPMAPKARFSK